MDPTTVVRVRGLTKLDRSELAGSPGVSLEEASVPDGSYGELGTFTAIFAISALTALAAYLLRKHENESFDEIVEIIHPDGRIERRAVHYDSSSTEPPDAAILKQIRGPVF